MFFFVMILAAIWSTPAFAAGTLAQCHCEPGYQPLLTSDEELMTSGGARLLHRDDGTPVVLGVGQARPADNSASALADARRIAAIQARVAILEMVAARKISSSRESRSRAGNNPYSLFTQKSTVEIEGLIKRLPVVGSWRFVNSDWIYVAVGRDLGNSRQPLSATSLTTADPETAKRTVEIAKLEGEEPFVSIIRRHPLVFQQPEEVHLLQCGRQTILISTGAARLSTNPLASEKIARLRAIKTLLGHRQGIRLKRVENLSDTEMLAEHENGKAANPTTYKLLSDYFGVDEERINGAVRALPVVARWQEKDGTMLHVAIGEARK